MLYFVNRYILKKYSPKLKFLGSWTSNQRDLKRIKLPETWSFEPDTGSRRAYKVQVFVSKYVGDYEEKAIEKQASYERQENVGQS